MTNRPSKSLAQMAAEAGQGDAAPKSIAGKPADVCPYCGCAMFANGTDARQTAIYRYVVCKKPRGCGRTFQSKQAPAVLLREISRTGQTALSIRRESA